jgi:transposase
MRYELTDHEWVAIKPMLPNSVIRHSLFHSATAGYGFA